MTYADIERQLVWSIGVSPTICKFVRLNEKPSVWRHACFYTGVSVINTPNRLTLEGVIVEFIYCQACQKVIYYVEDQV